MTIPDLVAQCRIDAVKAFKLSANISALSFHFTNRTVEEMTAFESDRKEFSKFGETVCICVAERVNDKPVFIHFDSVKLTETEIVEVLYPPIEA